MNVQLNQKLTPERKPRPVKTNRRLIALMWFLVLAKVLLWHSTYWLAGTAELAYIAVAVFLICTRPRANRINGGIVLLYECSTYLLNFVLGKFGITVPHGL